MGAHSPAKIVWQTRGREPRSAAEIDKPNRYFHGKYLIPV
jgi:hypothetical protein